MPLFSPSLPTPFNLQRFCSTVLPALVLACWACSPLWATTLRTVVGVVQSADGTPIPGARVSLEELQAVSTDASGAFRMEGIPAGSFELRARALGWADARQSVEVSASAAEATTSVTVTLSPAESIDEEISVVAGYSLLGSTPKSSSVLTKEEMSLAPHFGDDLYRAISILPGTATSDFGAGFTVRGGFQSETLVLFDGLELFEPFHLKMLEGGFFSIVDPEVTGNVELISSGFGAEYGTRQTAVLEMSSADWNPTDRFRFAVSFSNLSAAYGGITQSGSTDWLASLRRGYLDLLLELSGEDDAPGISYWDAFGRVRHRTTDRSDWSFSVLAAGDTFDYTEQDDDDPFVGDATDDNTSLWLRHLLLVGNDGVLDSTASWTRLDSERRFDDAERVGGENELRQVFQQPKFDILTLKQDLALNLGDRHMAKVGWSARSYDGSYHYRRSASGIVPVFNDPRFVNPNGERAASFDRKVERYGVYVADRIELGKRWVAELGVRIDRDDHFKSNEISPRLNLVADYGAAGVFRFAAGRFRQAHRITELAVADGDLEIYPDEVSDLVQIGYQKSFAGGRWMARAEAYRREVEDPKPRYQNIFDTFTPFPELESDRVHLRPESADTEGVELFLGYRGTGKWNGWASYVWSSATDRIDGRDVARYFDQTHAVTLNLQYSPNDRWSINGVWIYHTGWPTTDVSLAFDPQLGPYLAVGPLYESNLPDYHRLDLRISRRIQSNRGKMTLFLDLQNAYNRKNIHGFEFHPGEIELDSSGNAVLEVNEAFGALPSLGFSWQF